jgi:hypothetical protein
LYSTNNLLTESKNKKNSIENKSFNQLIPTSNPIEKRPSKRITKLIFHEDSSLKDKISVRSPGVLIRTLDKIPDTTQNLTLEHIQEKEKKEDQINSLEIKKYSKTNKLNNNSNNMNKESSIKGNRESPLKHKV